MSSPVAADSTWMAARAAPPLLDGFRDHDQPIGKLAFDRIECPAAGDQRKCRIARLGHGREIIRWHQPDVHDMELMLVILIVPDVDHVAYIDLVQVPKHVAFAQGDDMSGDDRIASGANECGDV